MPLMREVLDPATVAMLDAVAPDVEVECEIPAFALQSVAALADWVDGLNHAASDQLTEAHVGDPLPLVEAYERYLGGPLVWFTTVINQPMPALKPVVNQSWSPRRCQTLNVDGTDEAASTQPDPPRWLGSYAVWREIADRWQQGGREDDATRCSLAATMAALQSQFPKSLLLPYKGV